jgi:predicted DNA-binding transcriptional regulator AlpA
MTMTKTLNEQTLNTSIRPDCYLRLNAILSPDGPLPISRSSWWLKVRNGDFPQPIKLGPRITVWRGRDILALIERFEKGAK